LIPVNQHRDVIPLWCFYQRCLYQSGTLLVLAVQEYKKKKSVTWISLKF